MCPTTGRPNFSRASRMACGSMRQDAAAGGSSVRSTNCIPIPAIHSISSRTSWAGWFMVPISIVFEFLSSGLQLLAVRTVPGTAVEQFHTALHDLSCRIGRGESSAPAAPRAIPGERRHGPATASGRPRGRPLPTGYLRRCGREDNPSRGRSPAEYNRFIASGQSQRSRCMM